MAHVAEKTSGDSSGLTDQLSSGNLGGGLWEYYKKIVMEEGADFNELSDTSMNGVLTFAGLFAATLAAFLAETYKSLSPDSDESGGDLTSSAVVINTLWVVALVISLLCALLATLIQDWTKTFLRAQAHPTAVTLEQQCLEHMSAHMGAQRYGLPLAPRLVVGLLHAAVVLFLAGIVVFFWHLNPIPARAALGVAGGSIFIYAVASALPLFDASCPFRTPLTDVYVFIIMLVTVIVPGALVYACLLIAAAWQRITKGPLNPGIRRTLNPVMMASQLKDPYATSRVYHAIKDYFTRRKSEEPPPLLPLVFDAIMGNDQIDETAVNAEKVRFLWDRVGPYAMEHPEALQYVVGALIDGWSPVVDDMLIGLCYDAAELPKIAAALGSVHTTFAATSMLRLLQLLFQAEDANDRALRATVGQGVRWQATDAIVDAFAGFTRQLDALRQAEIEQRSTELLAALSSFRTTLLQLLIHTSPSSRDAKARTQILRMFAELQRYDGTKLQRVSADDPEDMMGLLSLDRGDAVKVVVAKLASRNCLTLIAGAKESDWEGAWDNPDRRYLRRTTPGTLRWRELFPAAAQRGTSAASAFFRDFLKDVGLGHWLVAGSAFTTPPHTSLKAAAVVALRDVANTVDFRPLIQEPSRADHDLTSASTAAERFEIPGSPRLDKVEEGTLSLSHE
ncbi:unnamed protein product [Peniophora sp. CBMAI 1063]|nr:unnamed protein product [Peniophora sp. CBMAI 1063]